MNNLVRITYSFVLLDSNYIPFYNLLVCSPPSPSIPYIVFIFRFLYAHLRLWPCSLIVILRIICGQTDNTHIYGKCNCNVNYYYVSPSNEGRHIVLVRFFCFLSAKLVRNITFLSFQIGQLYLVCGCMTIRRCVAYRIDLRGLLTFDLKVK